MAAISAVAVSTSGTAVTFAAATSGGDTLQTHNKHTTLIVRNGGAADITVTLTAVSTCNQGQLHNAVITCPLGKDTEIAIPGHVLEADGTVAVGYSAVTSVTVAAVNN